MFLYLPCPLLVTDWLVILSRVTTCKLSCMDLKVVLFRPATCLVRICKLSCMDLKVVLYRAATCLVWTCKLSCMDLKVVLYRPATCLVWTCKLSCMDRKVVLYRPATCLVWTCQLSCMGLKVVLYRLATCLVWTCKLSCMDLYVHCHLMDLYAALTKTSHISGRTNIWTLFKNLLKLDLFMEIINIAFCKKCWNMIWNTMGIHAFRDSGQNRLTCSICPHATAFGNQIYIQKEVGRSKDGWDPLN
jgi:hypothetical protein